MVLGKVACTAVTWPDPRRASTNPASRSLAYAEATGVLLSPKASARLRSLGSLVLAASRPSTSSIRIRAARSSYRGWLSGWVPSSRDSC